MIAGGCRGGWIPRECLWMTGISLLRNGSGVLSDRGGFLFRVIRWVGYFFSDAFSGVVRDDYGGDDSLKRG